MCARLCACARVLQLGVNWGSHTHTTHARTHAHTHTHTHTHQHTHTCLSHTHTYTGGLLLCVQPALRSLAVHPCKSPTPPQDARHTGTLTHTHTHSHTHSPTHPYVTQQSTKDTPTLSPLSHKKGGLLLCVHPALRPLAVRPTRDQCAAVALRPHHSMHVGKHHTHTQLTLTLTFAHSQHKHPQDTLHTHTHTHTPHPHTGGLLLCVQPALRSLAVHPT